MVCSLSRSLLCGLIVSGCLLALGTGAQARDFPTTKQKFEFDGKKFNAPEIAGEDVGDLTVTLGPKNGRVDGKPVALAGIWIDETGDEPCAVKATFRTINGPPHARHFYTKNFDSACSVSSANLILGSNLIRKGPGVYAVETGNLASARWSVRSLKVCSNQKSNNRGKLVKGIQVIFVDQDSEAGLRNVDNVYPAKQPNCKEDWLPRGISACPDDSVAMSLRVVTQDIGNKQSITGLGLVCRKVKLVPLIRPTRTR